MFTIIIEGVLFLALIAAVGTLFYLILMYTPAGVRLRQTRNRRQIDHAVGLGHALQHDAAMRQWAAMRNAVLVAATPHRRIAAITIPRYLRR